MEGLQVRGVRESSWIDLPSTLSHPNLPDTREETASPEAVKSHEHIAEYAPNFPTIDPTLQVIILIGTDCGEAMRTECFGEHHPFVHHTALGWALVGPSRLDSRRSDAPRALRASILPNREHPTAKPGSSSPKPPSVPLIDPFIEPQDDDLPCFPKEDQDPDRVTPPGIPINEEGNLLTPLPFKPNACSDSDEVIVSARSRDSLAKLSKEMASNCTEITNKLVEDLSPNTKPRQISPYIPASPVIHEKKGKLRIAFVQKIGKLRIVFDRGKGSLASHSTAQHGTTIQVLMTNADDPYPATPEVLLIPQDSTSSFSDTHEAPASSEKDPIVRSFSSLLFGG